MKRYSDKTEHTLITFHIGRGGRFWNAGHRRYMEQDTTIDSYTHDLFINTYNHHKVKRKVAENSILKKFEDEIMEALCDGDYETLSEYGIAREEAGELYYFTAGGSNTYLLVDNDGTGSIDIDGDYNTTYVCELKDVDENEAKIILESTNFVSDDVREYLLEQFDLRSEYESEEVES